jgi:hypothetical protein
MAIRYVFTGEVIEDSGKVFGVFIESATWGPLRKLLDVSGILPARRVHESEQECVDTVRAILRGNAIHGDVKDLEGYRNAWRSIRAKKQQLGLPLDTDSIG